MRIREMEAKMLPGTYRQLRESWTIRIPGDLLLAIMVLLAVDAQGVRYGLAAAQRLMFSDSYVLGR